MELVVVLLFWRGETTPKCCVVDEEYSVGALEGNRLRKCVFDMPIMVFLYINIYCIFCHRFPTFIKIFVVVVLLAIRIKYIL
jgi:hypothetical protein